MTLGYNRYSNGTLAEKEEVKENGREEDVTSGAKRGVRSTVVERATYMRVYAGSSPTSTDHRKELI